MESLFGSSQKILGDPCSSSVIFKLLCIRKHLEGLLKQIISFLLSCSISWSEEVSEICLSNGFPSDAEAARPGSPPGEPGSRETGWRGQ